MSHPQRKYNFMDKLLIRVDQSLRAIVGTPAPTTRPSPAEQTAEAPLNPEEQAASIALMRVNHAGEVAAQALYHGQALISRTIKVKQELAKAAHEENDHLQWCQDRIFALGGRTSYLTPLWYGGAFAIGAVASLVGDKWNLGFLAETEKQVSKHLEGHLHRLPENDRKSRAIVKQMRSDEQKHASMALHAGAHELPGFIKQTMQCLSKAMTKTAYWV